MAGERSGARPSYVDGRRLLERLGVELPVVQAGMGGGLARHELAVAVSEAGGLGTIGTLPPRALARELAAARAQTGRPIAVNLIQPLVGRRHWEAAARADVIVTHWGRPRRRSGGVWIHQCGSVAEARAACAAGADAVIAQGVEAGGHTRASICARELLERVQAALPAGYPVLIAGGIAGAAGVRAALGAGAAAAVLGTRFLMTTESHAHPGYKARLVEGRETILTELFGLGWPAPHRVLPNAATRRWLDAGRRCPWGIRALNRISAPLGRLPLIGSAPAQRVGLPFLTPLGVTDDRPESQVEAGALYAGETVARIDDLRDAGGLTRDLVRT
jgi:NAD(P)H-dependent flavin oxidoreductase YrpB (nitropropane dioxygenase family)